MGHNRSRKWENSQPGTAIITNVYDADAVRARLHDMLVNKYGSIEAAADRMRVPRKSFYRAFTQKGKDRTKTVSLELVMRVIVEMQKDDPSVNVDVVFGTGKDH